MNFRQLQESDIAFMAEYSLYGKEHWKAMSGQTEYNHCLEHEGRILCVGGFKMINNFTAYGWFDMSEFAKDHIITTYRAIKEWVFGYKDINGIWVPGFCETNGIRRLEAYVEAGFEAGHNIVKHLGFEFEYRAKNFFGDIPADIYAITFKERL